MLLPIVISDDIIPPPPVFIRLVKENKDCLAEALAKADIYSFKMSFELRLGRPVGTKRRC